MWNKGGSLSLSESEVISISAVATAKLANSRRSLVIPFAEIRPSDTRASLHDIQTIQILRLVSSYDLWFSWRGTGFDITRLQPDRCHEGEERELCMEVRYSSFLPFFSMFLSLMG